MRSDLGGGQIDVNAFPGVVPTRIGEKAGKYLDVKIALACKVTIEPAASEAGVRHDLVDGYFLKSVPVEQLASRLDDLPSDVAAVAGWIGHEFLLLKTCFGYGAGSVAGKI